MSKGKVETAGQLLAWEEESTRYMHEDELPANMPKEDYEKWYAASWIPGGVGVRVGPIYPWLTPKSGGTDTP